VLQPDFGQTMLIALVWGALVLHGRDALIWVGGLAGVAGAGWSAPYFTVPHVAQRIQRFMDRGSGDTFKSIWRWNPSHAAAGSAKARAKARSSASCRKATRLVFAVGRGRIRHRALLMLLALFALHRDPLAAARAASTRTLQPLRRLRPCHPVRAAIGINMAVNLHLMPGQGHDAAVRLPTAARR
jgi:cell division protein FtsW